jgi:hypothetical protein
VQNEQRRFQDCSVLLILALAFSDGAFKDITNPDELLKLSPMQDTPRLVPFRPDMMGQFVLRSARNLPVSDNLFRQQYLQMVKRAGYKPDQMHLYNIRRGVANLVKGKTAIHVYVETRLMRSYRSRPF